MIVWTVINHASLDGSFSAVSMSILVIENSFFGINFFEICKIFILSQRLLQEQVPLFPEFSRNLRDLNSDFKILKRMMNKDNDISK